MNPSLIILANNHILNQGIRELNAKIDILNKNNIAYVGVGSDLNQASRPYILDMDGKKIGIYACAETEFTIAKENYPGANPFDPLESLDHIAELKKETDYVIVLYHGGNEHYRYLSPYLQKIFRKMIDKGANIVITQHSHCIGASESYREDKIVYGQGNFIFDYSNSEFWKTSLIIEVKINQGLTLDYIPIVKENNVIRLAPHKIKAKILAKFKERSNNILKDNFLEKTYRDFAEANIDSYLRSFAGFGKWISRVDRILLKGMLINKIYNRKKLLLLQNFIECEAHRELMIEGLKRRRNE